MSKCVLVTGGAGFIGSHTVVELCAEGYEVVVVDSLVNASIECINRVREITGNDIPFCKVDLLDKEVLRKIFKQYSFNYVIHFAGLKSVGESCTMPLEYYKNNLQGTITLLEVSFEGEVSSAEAFLRSLSDKFWNLSMDRSRKGTFQEPLHDILCGVEVPLMREFEVYDLVFSSSATVYGDPQYLPLDETHPVGGCTNPYGKTKYFIEEILSDLAISDKNWNIVLLRYFNPIGAHKTGRIGEDPHGIPNNLMPFISQVAVGRRPQLAVFGNKYDTPDGTGVRDYIHVVDLALGHVAALKKIQEKCGRKVFNLGTGNGYSVLEMVKAFEKASGKPVPYSITDPRPGDIASCYADPKIAADELGWKAERGLEEMCEDLWRWQCNNPQGFSMS